MTEAQELCYSRHVMALLPELRYFSCQLTKNI